MDAALDASAKKRRVTVAQHPLNPKLLRGSTFPIKEQLKKLGGVWDGDQGGWWIPAANWAEAEALLHLQEDGEREAFADESMDWEAFRKD